MEILIKRLNEKAKLPSYGKETGPGIDLFALENITLQPGEKVVVSTGIAMALPVGYVGLMSNNAGYSLSKSLHTELGIIDSGYRTEIKIELINNGTEQREFVAGDKVAEMLIQKIELPLLIEAEELS